MSVNSNDYTSYRGEYDNKKGIFYEVKHTGGPGKYPYTVKYFVPDGAAGGIDTRNEGDRKPWDVPDAVKVK